MYISVTGIKPKGITGWIYFLLYNIPASKASKDHDGLLASELSSRNGYLHTFTVWESRTHMIAYRSSPAHLKAMKCSGQPKLDSKLGFPSATAGGNPPFAVCGLRQL